MLRIGQINYCDITNGEGIRVSIFVSGCKFHCKECFNSKAQDYNFGKDFDSQMEDLILNYLKDSKYSGLSLLGGDVMCQDNDSLTILIELCKKVHKLKKDVWCWTGYTFEELLSANDSEAVLRKELLSQCDVLIDGRFEYKHRDVTLSWRGSTNQRVIDVQASLKNNTVIEY